MRFGLRIGGGYLLIMLGGLLLVRLSKTMLDCGVSGGIELSCTLFGVYAGSPLVSVEFVVTMILYAWPVVALVCAISFMLAAVFRLRGRIRKLQ